MLTDKERIMRDALSKIEDLTEKRRTDALTDLIYGITRQAFRDIIKVDLAKK